MAGDDHEKNTVLQFSEILEEHGITRFSKLFINKDHKTTRQCHQLKRRYKFLNRLLEDGCSSHHQTVSLNLLLAACAAQLTHDPDIGNDGVEDHLLNVLKRDPDNINALVDLFYFYGSTQEHDEKKECEDKLIKLLANENIVLLKVKSQAERAYALAYDDHCGGTKSLQRYEESTLLYSQALSQLESCGLEDKSSWYYIMGENCRRSYNIMTKEEQSVKVEMYDNAAKYYYSALNGSTKLQCDTWAALGLLFCKKPKLSKGTRYPPFIGECPDLKYFYNEKCLKCFEKALDLCRDIIPVKILADYGSQCYRLGNKHAALMKLDQVIQNEPDNPRSWFAYSARSKIYRQSYKEAAERFQKLHDSPPDISLLKKAKSDSDKCLRLNESPQEYANLGEIHYLIAVDASGNVCDRQELKKALRCFLQAEECQDGADRPDLHQRRGLCLVSLGQNRKAIECFKRAVECEHNKNYNKNFVHLMKTFFKEYRHEGGKEKYMLSEIAYWFRYGIDKYVINVDVFTTGGISYAQELLQLGEHLQNNQKFIYARRCFNILKKDPDVEIKNKALKLLLQIKNGTSVVTNREPAHVESVDEADTVDGQNNPVSNVDDTQTLRKPENCTLKTEQDNEPDAEALSVNSHMDSSGSSLISTEKIRNDIKSEDSVSISDLSVATGNKKVLLSVTEDVDSNNFIYKAPDGTEHIKTNICPDTISQILSQIEKEYPEKINIPPAPKDAKNKHGKKYDFFAVFSEGDDADWVWYTLLPKLEKELELKGCITQRDCTPGKNKLENIIDAIENSVFVIFILTPAFFNCLQHCVCALKQTLATEEYQIIPIRKQNYDTSMKTAKLLKAIEHVEFCKHYDWQQIEQALREGLEN
ncbi:uncharacterized protein LOC102804436 [Saccoglossus kowalevskii]|uniref:Uncharacterized protein LOC102804436 n=1 Tax=Saccoglossus kowalevskii TaxID=10224 RepID=A0ABM0M0X0_SACKO|nr:PREDICTED: uncharacterized protein LOC102804436 [Saccoglossus kowalevskii]